MAGTGSLQPYRAYRRNPTCKTDARQIGRVDPTENKRRVRRAKREIRNRNPAKHNGRKLFFRAFAKGERMGGNLRQRILQNRVE